MCWKLHACTDEEAEEDGEGADVSSLLSCPAEGCKRTYQKYQNLKRHLLIGKCKLVSEKHTLLDTAKLAYAEKVHEGSTIQPTLAALTTTEISSECPLVQGWALKGTKKATRFNENQRQYLDNKFQIGQKSGHKADPEKVSRDMRYARRDNGERRLDLEEFLTWKSSWLHSRFRTTLHVLLQNWSMQLLLSQGMTPSTITIARRPENRKLFPSARLAVLHQCELLHPIVFDTLIICSLYSSIKLTKLSVAQLRLICSYFNMDIEEQQSRRKAPYITFISETCRVLFLRVLAMLSECKISSDNITCPICYILFSCKPILMLLISELFHLLYRSFRSWVRYVEVINNHIFRAG